MDAHPIAAWHRVLAARDVTGLHRLLADDAVFHSPIMHAPQRGRALVAAYLSAAFVVFSHSTFRYVRQIVGANDAALEFAVEIDGVHVNGVDLIGWNEHGLITDFKVMIRPLKAIELIHRKMAQVLQST